MTPLLFAAGVILVSRPVIAATLGDPSAAIASTVPPIFPKGVGSSGWIPFEFFRGSRLFIPAEINGVPTRVMLDSGASQTVIDARYVKTLQVKGTGHFTGQGAGGTAPYTVLHGVNIKLGAITFSDTDAVGIDLAAVEKQVGHELPVVLGGDAFARCVVDIDFTRHRIAFRDPATFVPPANATAVALTKAGENFAIPTMIEGLPATVVFDLGNASALVLYRKFWDKAGFLGTRPVSTSKTGGLGGMHVSKLGSIKGIVVAGANFADVPATLETEQKPMPVDGNIGMPLLRRFHLLVDLPHHRILFAHPVDTTTPFEINHTGLTLAPGSAGESVLYVAPGSPAALADLEAGDMIVTLDGLGIQDWEAHAALSNWIYGTPGQKIRVGLASGDTRVLAFGRYF